MNTRFKLNVDHYVGGTLVWLLNVAARAVACIWKRDHSLNRPPRTILFLKFMGLGSIARAAFLLAAARAKYPHARIAFGCFSGCAGLVRLYPQVDEVLVVRDQGLRTLALDTWRLLWWSWRQRVELVIDLEVHAKYSTVLAGLTLARDRAGFGGLTSRFRRGLYTHLVFFNPIRRVDLAYRQLGRALGLDPTPHCVRPVPPPAARDEAAGLLEDLGVAPGDRVVGVNVNASDLRLERRWPAENFARVIATLQDLSRLHVLLIGSPVERAYVTHVQQLIGPLRVPVHNIAGRLSFAGFVALLERLNVLLTTDSGPLHVAAALGTATVSVWGPGHPQHYAPHGPQHTVFYRPIYCSPCIYTTDHPPCGGDNQCLKRLGWERVAAALHKQLEAPLPAPRRSACRDENDVVGPLPVFGYWQRESVPLRKPVSEPPAP